METLNRREARWFAVQVKRNLFAKAEKELSRYDLRVFAPKLERQKLHYGKMRSFVSLLFPGYLFVEGEDDQHVWNSIRATEGLTRLVLRDKYVPATVPQPFIDELLSRSDPDGKIISHGELKAGDNVSIVKGPFAGLVTQIHAVDEAQRIWILLDILGASRSVAVRQEQFLKLGPR